MSNKNTKVNANSKETKPAIKVIDAKKFYEGSVFTNFYGERFIVDKYNNKNDVDVHFLDEHQYSCKTYRSVLVSGNLKNPYHPGKYGGYVGVGPYGRKNDAVVYNVWNHILVRVFQSKSEYYNNFNSYKEDSICEEWLNFQTFAQWYYDYIGKLNPNFKYNLDKDIYQWGFKSKIYSPETCCIIPESLNLGLSIYENPRTNLPTGVVMIGDRFYPNLRSSNNKNESYGGFGTPEEAFEIYKKIKLKDIREQAEYYLNNGALLKKDFECICNLDIKPYY